VTGVHPVADLFPMLPDDELKELAADIAERGLLQLIVLDSDGRILDGRNRFAACEIAGIEPEFVTYDGDDPDGYALAVNGQRRSMTKGQKALVAGEFILSLRKDHGVNQSAIARSVGVHTTLIDQAVDILTWARGRVAGIMAAGTGWSEAREAARKAREHHEAMQTQLKRLETEAEDLHEQVTQKGLPLDDAVAALEQREKRVREEAEQQRSREEAERQQREREHREAIGRYVSGVTAFLHGWNTAINLASDPNREDVLEALEDQDRERFLAIEQILKEGVT
jgi:ParB-like chromosome segregation protein Spo0J